MATAQGALGILVGGGPAPGINGVIGAATIEARENGHAVLGFYDGYQNLIKGDGSKHARLEIDNVSRIHFDGGSILRTSRANPTKDPKNLKTVVDTLLSLDVRYLISIGGDDTAFSASQVEKVADGRIRVAHVPKTIDNDLPLPPAIPTFGFQTARHVGVQIVQNLMADAKTCSRWYVVVAMGRSAGHLALGIGKAAGAPLTLIPEEFEKQTTLNEICDIIEGSVLKREAAGRPHGVVILAEGLVEKMSQDHLKEVFGGEVELDDHGHIRLDELPFGQKVRDEVKRRCKARGKNLTMVNKNLGYELRCADPIPFDCEYTRDLGFGAVRFLLAGGSGAVITFHGGKLNPLPFDHPDLRDPTSSKGRFRVRRVDVKGESYQVAREYMIRLDKSDRAKIADLARVANLTPEEFTNRFGYLMS